MHLSIPTKVMEFNGFHGQKIVVVNPWAIETIESNRDGSVTLYMSSGHRHVVVDSIKHILDTIRELEENADFEEYEEEHNGPTYSL